MTFDDFIKKYDGKGIDFDGSFGNQCMDLYRQYVKEVLGFPQSPAVVGAKDVWNSFLQDKFEKIENSTAGVPQKGDVVIWGTKIGKFGHIAVFVEGDSSNFKSFDQNFPVGSLCHIQEHDYVGVLGWLKPRIAQAIVDEFKWFRGLLAENNIHLEDSEGRVREIFDQAKKYEQAQKDRDKALKNLAESEGRAVEYETKFNAEMKINANLENEILDLRKAVTDRESLVSSLRMQLADCSQQAAPPPQGNWLVSFFKWLTGKARG